LINSDCGECLALAQSLGKRGYDVGRLKITTAILQLIPRGSVANGPFSSIKSVACKPPYTPDLGVFVQAQVAAQQDKPNPVSFSFLDGINGRVWLASDRHGAKLIGDDRHWRVNVAHVLKLGREKCPPTLWRPMAKTLLEKAPAYARKPRL
jgi:hypothetical protein